MSGLILTRKPGESVEIGANMKLTVIGVCGNQVRIMFDVPRNIAVHCTEVADRIRREHGEEINGNLVSPCTR